MEVMAPSRTTTITGSSISRGGGGGQGAEHNGVGGDGGGGSGGVGTFGAEMEGEVKTLYCSSRNHKQWR